MTSLFYSATHSSGRVHLRKSAGRAYTHAVVGPRFGSQSFCGRIDLAHKHLAQCPLAHGMELVEARSITKEEFAALTKASKQGFATRFMGKRFTKTLDGAAKPYTCAIGFHDTEHTTRHATPSQWAKRVEELRSMTDSPVPEWRAQNIASMEKALACGHWEQKHAEYIGVTFCRDEAEALEYIASRNRAPAFRTAELIALEAV